MQRSDPQVIVRVPPVGRDVSAQPPQIVIGGAPGTEPITIQVPRTTRDLAALKARREELSNQLQSVDGRRSRLISQLKTTGDPVAVKGLQNRLAVLDARQVQLETDIAQTGQALTSASAGLLSTTTSAPFAFTNKEVMGLSVLAILFVAFPMAIGVARNFWKRAGRPAIPDRAMAETAQRLERLEGSVDAIAIEIERISEGQRFVTKLLSDSPASVLGAGSLAPEPVRVRK
jgi:hypothetical protein